MTPFLSRSKLRVNGGDASGARGASGASDVSGVSGEGGTSDGGDARRVSGVRRVSDRRQ